MSQLLDPRKCQRIKSDGTQCQNYPIAGSQWCKFHGAMAAKGIANSQFKDGRYSRYVPKALLDKYEAARDDPELLSQKDDIAILETRISQLLQRLDLDSNIHEWDFLEKKLQDLRVAVVSGANAQATTIIADLAEFVEKGQQDVKTWNEITRIMDIKRKVSESERKRLIEMDQIITAEKAMLLITMISTIVKKYVTDSATLSAISQEFVRLSRRDPSQLD